MNEQDPRVIAQNLLDEYDVDRKRIEKAIATLTKHVEFRKATDVREATDVLWSVLWVFFATDEEVEACEIGLESQVL